MAGTTGPDGHEEVLRHVFAAGLALHSVAARVDGDVHVDVVRALESLDTAVRHLRELCFRELRAAEGQPSASSDRSCTSVPTLPAARSSRR